MNWKRAVLAGMLVIAAAGLSYAAAVETEEAPRIRKKEVKEKFLGVQGVVILDARTEASWSSSDKMIKGAVRVDPDHVDSWADKISKNKMVIVYCS